MRWQDILKYGSGGTIPLLLLLALLTNLSGISDVKYSDDQVCTNCVSHINFTSSYWEFCFEHGQDKDIVYRKTTSPRLWINMDKIDYLIPTEPKTPIRLQIPTRGSDNWRDIQEGDCLKRTTKANPLPIRLRIVGDKEINQTVKWGFNLDHWSSEGINIDPSWFGIDVRNLKECSILTKISEKTVQKVRLSNKTYIYINNQTGNNETRINFYNQTYYEEERKRFNATSCIDDGFNIKGKIINYRKQGWNCNRNGFFIECTPEFEGNSCLGKTSGKSCITIDIRDMSVESRLDGSVKELKIE